MTAEDLFRSLLARVELAVSDPVALEHLEHEIAIAPVNEGGREELLDRVRQYRIDHQRSERERRV